MSIVPYFIVNARIGEKKIRALRQILSAYFPEGHYPFHITQYGGHARVLAREAIQAEQKMIVAVGGDGTVNEVLQEIVHTQTTLGIIPCGSGNGLARHGSIPLNMKAAVDCLFQGHDLSIDIGKANDVYFISNAGVGFDAWICHTIRESKLRGLKMYVSKVLQHYLRYTSDEYTIEYDEQIITQKAFFLNVANGSEFGYGFRIAPSATLQDGMLDLILVKKINVWNGFRFVWDGWNNRLNKNKNCLFVRAKSITVRGKNLHYFQTDGDAQTCDLQCLFTVQASALRLRVPNHMQSL
jgi:YegS/Rv2252/BmrU family lipid kinase